MIRRFVIWTALIISAWFCFLNKPVIAGERTVVLSLEECIDRALRENLNLRSYHLGLRAGELTVRQAESYFDPAVSLSVERNESVQPNYLDYIPVSSIESDNTQWNLTLNQKVTTGGSWGFGFFNTLSESNVEKQKNYTSYLGLSITQPLLRGFGKKLNRSNIYLARMSSDAAVIDYEQRAVSLVHSVAKAYWDLVYARETLKVHEISIAQADSLLTFNEMGLELGVMTQSDVLEAKSALVARHQEVLMQQNLIRDYEDELRRLLHLTEGNDWEYTIEPTDIPAADPVRTELSEALDMAFGCRPDYKNALNVLEQNQLQQTVAKNALLPNLDLNAGYRINGSGSNFSTDMEELTDTDAYGWNVGLTLSCPLWNRDAKADNEKRSIALRRSQLALEELEEVIETDIRASIRNIEVCREQLEVTKIAVEVNELKLRLEEERFRNNLTSSYYVLEFQRDLADARNRYNKAMIDYSLAVTNFRAARGTLLSDNNITIVPVDNR